jgi:hypothetical protein
MVKWAVVVIATSHRGCDLFRCEMDGKGKNLIRSREWVNSKAVPLPRTIRRATDYSRTGEANRGLLSASSLGPAELFGSRDGKGEPSF